MIAYLHQSGYSPNEDTLIAMRIHGATPEWMTELKSRGYDHVDLEKLQRLGYSHPEPDELVAMHIHNVTPEYISDLRSRGMQNLSIDHLVSMRIHGID
jgi:hypothetical protein